MFSGLIEKVALVIAARVAERVIEEVLKPENVARLIDTLPDIGEKIASEVIDRLPAPFRDIDDFIEGILSRISPIPFGRRDSR